MASILTFEQALEEIADRLGGRRAELDRIEDFLNEAQLWMAKSDIELTPLETNKTFTCTTGVDQYSVRTDLAITDFIGIRYVRNNTTNIGLERFTFREFRQISGQSQAPPVRWSRHGDLFVLDPIPDSAAVLLIDYRREPTLGVLEFGGTWLEPLLRLTTHIAWNAYQEPEMAQAQYRMLPAWMQIRLATPLTEAEWEAMWDDNLGMEPGMVAV